MVKCKRIIIALIITLLVLFSDNIGWLESIAKDREKGEYTNSDITVVIDEHIHNAKYREILKDRFIDGLTLEAIAEKRDMSTTQVKTIIGENKGKIFDKL